MAGPADSIVLGMGCFWGAEMRMGKLAGVIDVANGSANADDARRDSVRIRGDAEVVKVVFDTARISLEDVLAHFWENHDPTQGDRQGNDIGSLYRSAIFTRDETQMRAALATREVYQAALAKAGYRQITTEIAPLKSYRRAEEHHQDYLKRNPLGYCGLGGTGVRYPDQSREAAAKEPDKPGLDAGLNYSHQLIVFEAVDCAFCRQFKAEILDHWKAEVSVVRTFNSKPPDGWQLEKALFATPTIVLFEKGREVSRFTGYNGDRQRFWKWLGFHLLSPAQQKIAFEQGTEYPGTGSHLDEKRPGTFVDPITGAPLFRSNAKFDSGTGWPSFFNPVPRALTEHVDVSHGMRRVEVRSASSGIHLGHVFDDGPPPTGKRYCINGNVLKFVPDNPR
jgi:peptide methionine sulfoxide reductase msrA/msrB